ncbi:MAG: preprotein translocase subunit SecE [Bacteroidota bacterium]
MSVSKTADGSSNLSTRANKIEMDNIKSYLQASYDELTTKVSWPTWKELQANALVVSVASVIIALVIGLMDMISNILFSDIIYKIAG